MNILRNWFGKGQKKDEEDISIPFVDDVKHNDAQGVLLGKQGKHEEAIAFFERAIKLDPNYATARHNKGVSLHTLGRYREAIECFDQAISLMPGYASAWLNRGNALAAMGELDEAVACFEEAQSLGHPRAAQQADQVRRILNGAPSTVESLIDNLVCLQCGKKVPWFGGPPPSFGDALVHRCPFCESMWLINLRTGEVEKLS